MGRFLHDSTVCYIKSKQRIATFRQSLPEHLYDYFCVATRSTIFCSTELFFQTSQRILNFIEYSYTNQQERTRFCKNF